MKATGIVRQLDTLGRIVLPIELRRTMDINAKDLVVLERMCSSKNMVVIISEDTAWDLGMLNSEKSKAVDVYILPLIIAYVGYEYILKPRQLSTLWPKALSERIKNGSAICIHIPFDEQAVMAAISQFSVHSTGNNILKFLYTYYSKDTYIKWGYK